MIHADSVRMWEAESRDLRAEIGRQRAEIERLRAELAQEEALHKETWDYAKTLEAKLAAHGQSQ